MERRTAKREEEKQKWGALESFLAKHKVGEVVAIVQGNWPGVPCP
jgi:hypothetical protein